MTDEERKERARGANRRHYARNREAMLARNKESERCEQQREAGRRYYAKNREKRCAEARAWRENNLERAREYDRQYSLANKDQRRNTDLLRKYGITAEDYDRILEEQGGCCPLCDNDSPGRWHVDHCHETGKVRGILCCLCNTTLGRIEKYPVRLQRMLDYIEKNHQKGARC